MIISRTPLRISFAGGGTDLPTYYREEAGAVISTTINKYIYITVNPKFDSRIRASYSKTEMVDEVDQIQHELIRESLSHMDITGGIEITSISDIPSRGTGLGSSSSYTVGLLHALYAYQGRHAGAERLAQEATEIELERCHRVMGKQDQYAAANGGLQYYRFNPDESVFVDPIICLPETRGRIQERMQLFYTGMVRSAPSILSEQTENMANDARHRVTLRRMAGLADDMRDALRANDADAFGDILHAGWEAKRTLASGITNARIDGWYQRARDAGAIGGKILGAGGGGFLLSYAPLEKHQAIQAALPELVHVPFAFEGQGSKIIYVEESTLPASAPIDLSRVSSG
jgi:D-glycero-alpha-D-manno-heptose-7-phosphate kinase